LRIFDFKAEKYLLAFRSYYGGFLCVAWSPDGEFLLTGGEDDLIALWAFKEKKLVVRGRGHQSWVSAVAFDSWSCTQDNYIFASAGQDTRIILWEFSKSSIPKPRSKSGKRRDTLTDSSSLVNSKSEEIVYPVMVPVCLNTEIGFMEPLATHRAALEPLSDVKFMEDCLATSCWAGISRFWSRPAFATQLKFPTDEEDKKEVQPKTQIVAEKGIKKEKENTKTEEPEQQESNNETKNSPMKTNSQ